MRDYSKPVLSVSEMTSAERLGACEIEIISEFSPDGDVQTFRLDCEWVERGTMS